MLKKLRIVLALVLFAGITILLAGFGREWLAWTAKLQLLPSCLALNFLVIAGILLLTFIFGRIYCSTICPFGVFQDIIIWLRRRLGLLVNRFNVKCRRKDQPKLKPIVKHFKFSKERKVLRYTFLALTLAAIIAGIQLFIALIEPYSAYGRMVRAVAGTGMTPLLVTGLVTLVLISLCAWLWGRIWCNAVCPVGTALGLVSRFSVFKVRIDRDKCTDCGRCERGCKSSCINYKDHTVDYSRCVGCMDCVSRCKEKAISFRASLPGGKDRGTDEGRRKFLVSTAAIIGGAAVAKADNSLAPVRAKKAPQRTVPLVPPGSKGVKEFYSHCTACQLCITSCPNRVLRPSTDLEHLMQPVMGYEKGYCRPECTVCSEVCPTGAIAQVLKGQKHTISIGTARVNTDLCIAAKRGRGCGNCAYHCPSGAIRMGAAGGKKFRPIINEEVCTGCGACEFLCPVRPISAISVNGRTSHKTFED